MLQIKPKIIKFIILFVLIFIFSASLSDTTYASYNGANLIDDAVLRNSSTMNADQIQTFLDSKGSGLATKTFYFDCLATDASEVYYRNAGAPCEKTVLASQIIYYASKIYGINPQAVLATLQKEQSLVTTGYPTDWQINQAMGYGCPTTGGCGASNFLYQIDNGTWVLRLNYERASGNMTWWWTATKPWVCAGETNFYKPGLLPKQNVSFYDEDDVYYQTYFIENAATSALYCYTPHAYNNPQGINGLPQYGTTGRYYTGSYNFVYYFEKWFGSVKSFVQMENQRWMEVEIDTTKQDLISGEETGGVIEEGTQLKFTSKVYFNNQWYLRTEFDTNNKLFTVIPLSKIKDIEYEPLIANIYLEINKDGVRKIIPNTGAQCTATQFNSGYILKFTDRIIVNGVEYYRSAFDKDNAINNAIPLSSLMPIIPKTLDNPRYLETKNDTKKLHINTMTQDTESISAGTVIYFTHKIYAYDKLYLLTAEQSASQDPLAFIATDTQDPTAKKIGNTSRWMVLNRDIQKYSMYTSNALGGIFKSGKQLEIFDIFTIGGSNYYRTKYDSENNNLLAFPFDAMSEIQFAAMSEPRYLILNKSLEKEDPFTGIRSGVILQKNMRIFFSTKVEVNGITYLRSVYDTLNNNSFGIKLVDLNNL